MIILLGAFQLVKRRPLGITGPRVILFLVVALLGSLVPNYFSYQAAAQLPAGVMAVIISLVPMFAFPIAVAVGNDTFSILRALGILCGLSAVLALVGPSQSLPDPSLWPFVLMAMLAPLCYGVEGNFVAKFGMRGLSPVQALFGASVLGIVLIAPFVWVSGQWIDLSIAWGAPEWSLLGLSALHVCAYVGYVWLINNAGSVFAAQVAYLVMGFGVLWSIVLLDESYSIWVWAALGLMAVGIALVQPKRTEDA